MRIRIEVGVLGATGMVGQQFINQLAGHPWFDLKWLAARERSEGKRYADAAPWRLDTPIPEGVADRTVEPATPGVGPRLVFSALDAGVAGPLEQAFADAGHLVVSNARNHRMDPTVPLLVPEVNADPSPSSARRRSGGGGRAPSSPTPTAPPSS
jgi:aspartate-semialdehyde dehydrogenase